jgi:hypothetical protein
VKLTDLDPRWLYKNKVFAFRCPHCRTVWLTCKRVPMSSEQQWQIIDKAFGENFSHTVVGSKPQVAWKFSNLDFETMTVSPSLDASASGHWHGFIRQGQIA